jgi:hypothetical protein
MLALSVAQPGASLLILGACRVETRPWHTAHRGRLLLHASGLASPEARARCRRPAVAAALRRAGFDGWRDLPRGAVLGAVTLLDCVRVEDLPSLCEGPCGPFDCRPGLWAWLLADPVPLPVPVPARGRLGLFELALPSPATPEGPP